MRTIYAHGNVSIIDMAGEFYVYSGAKLVRVTQSLGMAREIASGL